MARAMKYALGLALLLLVPFAGLREHPRKVSLGPATQSQLEQKLEQRVIQFNTAGRTFVGSVAALAYDYGLPTAIEYADRQAARRPLHLDFRDRPVREVLEALVQQTPEYRMSFSDGIVDIYSLRARADDSNVLNRVIRDYEVTQKETREADFELLCELGQKLGSKFCGGSLAIGQWEPTRITLHLHDAKAYEVINAIVAQNGKAIWTVTARPDRMSKIQDGGSWYVYPLEGPFEEMAVEKLERVAR
jgi:hypothetical protein